MESKEWSKLWYNPQLDMELYHAVCIKRGFPLHMHDYYVICLVEQGLQSFLHRKVKHLTPPGGLILLSPGDDHTGEPADEYGFEYRALYPTVAHMQEAVFELTGKRQDLPLFPKVRIDDPVAISRVRFLGVGLAIFGVYLIIRESSNLGGTNRYIGDLILVVTGIVWSFYNFVTRKVVNKYPTVLITFYQTVAGAVAFLPLAWLEQAQWRTPTMDSITALLYLGVFCSVLAFLLYAYGLRRLSSSSAVTLMNLVPVFGVCFAVLFLHEPMSVVQLLGGFIVIAGIVLSVRPASAGRDGTNA